MFGENVNNFAQFVYLIEQNGFNNSQAPYDVCPNNDNYYGNTTEMLNAWASTFLADAAMRFNGMVDGLTFTTNDALTMMQLCAYEVLALPPLIFLFFNLVLLDEFKRLFRLLSFVHSRGIFGI